MREESSLLVKDSCFLDNDFTGQGTITVQSSASVSGNYVSEDDDLRCNFLASGTDDCTEATATSDLCVALEEAAPERRQRSGNKAAVPVSAAPPAAVRGAISCFFLSLLMF